MIMTTWYGWTRSEHCQSTAMEDRIEEMLVTARISIKGKLVKLPNW